MSKLYKSWKYFLCPIFLVLGVFCLISHKYLQAQIEFLWAMVFLIILRIAEQDSNSSTVKFELPKNSTVKFYTTGVGSGGTGNGSDGIVTVYNYIIKENK
jgi:hypothetical protein